MHYSRIHIACTCFGQPSVAMLLICCALLLLPVPASVVAQDELTSQPGGEHLIVVVGAAGSAEYDNEFSRWSQPWQELAKERQWKLTMIDGAASSAATSSQNSSNPTDLEALRSAIATHAESDARLWIVLLGHGTFSGGSAKFNLVGPDVSAKDLSSWLKPIRSEIVVINCSSSSAPFMPELAGPKRVLLTATRAGSEINFSRFGKYLSQSISDLSADVDHDLEVSLLEAFLAATARTERFYREEARLTTEHALLDDNGDRAGISGDFFRGVSPIKKAATGATVDGAVAKRIILYSSPHAPRFTPELALRRSEIETQLDALRNRKGEMEANDYLAELERLMLQLSEVYDAAEAG